MISSAVLMTFMRQDCPGAKACTLSQKSTFVLLCSVEVVVRQEANNI